MNQSHTIKSLSPRVAEKRAQQLLSTFDYLNRLDQGPSDSNPEPRDVQVLQKHLNAKGEVESSSLRARIEGTSQQGVLYLSRGQEASPTLQHWVITYRPEAIVSTRYSGDTCSDYHQKNEVLSLRSHSPSFEEEWKFSSRAMAGIEESRSTPQLQSIC